MFNRVVLVGNLTRDVELRYLNTGVAIATFGLASNRRYKKQDGTQVDDTCFIDVSMFGRSAEVANQYLRKGSKILVEGRLQFDTWVDQHGGKRSKHSVMAESMVMLDSKQSQGDYAQQDGGYSGGSGSYGSHNNSNYSNSANYSNPSGASSSRQDDYDANSSAKRGDPPGMPEIDIDEEIPF